MPTPEGLPFQSGPLSGAEIVILQMPSGQVVQSTVAAVVAAASLGAPRWIPIAVGDETTAMTTGAAKVTFRMPGYTLSDVRASVTTAPTGAAIQVDINKNTTSILSTKITIDAGEKTSVTATPPVISDPNIADDDEITIDIDIVGSTVAGAGLKVYIFGLPT